MWRDRAVPPSVTQKIVRDQDQVAESHLLVSHSGPLRRSLLSIQDLLDHFNPAPVLPFLGRYNAIWLIICHLHLPSHFSSFSRLTFFKKTLRFNHKNGLYHGFPGYSARTGSW